MSGLVNNIKFLPTFQTLGSIYILIYLFSDMHLMQKVLGSVLSFPPNGCSSGVYISRLHREADTLSKETSNLRCAIVSGDLLIKLPCPWRCCFHSPKPSLST